MNEFEELAKLQKQTGITLFEFGKLINATVLIFLKNQQNDFPLLIWKHRCVK